MSPRTFSLTSSPFPLLLLILASVKGKAVTCIMLLTIPSADTCSFIIACMMDAPMQVDALIQIQ